MAAPASTRFSAEVERGERFEFGENWSRFLSVLDDARIAEAEESLRSMLGRSDLTGLSFLDVGSGSGLFSLAAAGSAPPACTRSTSTRAACAAPKELRRRFPTDDGVDDRGRQRARPRVPRVARHL